MDKNKSILKSLLFGGFAVVIFSFLIVAICFYSLVSTSFEEQKKIALEDKKALLRNNADRISKYSLEVFLAEWSPMEKNYQLTLEIISQSTGASIIVFNSNGTIVATAGLDESKYVGGTISGNYVDEILSGKEISDTGTIQIFNDENVLAVGKPIKNEVTYGGVIISVPYPAVSNDYLKILPELIIAVLIAIIIAFILFYFISKKITDPIKEIDNAVTEFSMGKFSTRVECNEKNELGSLSENINRMADSIQNLEKMRSTFVSDVSHELRTPMTSITGFIEGILDGTIPPDKEEQYLSIVLSESKRLSRLVNDLLNISRLDGGYYKVNKSEFDINELMRLVLIKFEKEITEKNINVNLMLESESCKVYADNDGINQVATNILHNAIKFTPNGGDIDIKVYEKGGKVQVEIKNTGEGIPPDKIKYIWDRFYKTDTSRGNNPKGIGLGLFIVNSIIAKNGEKVWVESVEGEYAKFIFTLSHR